MAVQRMTSFCLCLNTGFVPVWLLCMWDSSWVSYEKNTAHLFYAYDIWFGFVWWIVKESSVFLVSGVLSFAMSNSCGWTCRRVMFSPKSVGNKWHEWEHSHQRSDTSESKILEERRYILVWLWLEDDAVWTSEEWRVLRWSEDCSLSPSLLGIV